MPPDICGGAELRAKSISDAKATGETAAAWLGLGGFGCCFNGIPALITLSGDTFKKKKKKDSKQHTFFIYIKSSNFLTTQVYF